jgi:hypothetical protein
VPVDVHNLRRVFFVCDAHPGGRCAYSLLLAAVEKFCMLECETLESLHYFVDLGTLKYNGEVCSVEFPKTNLK